MKWWLKSDFRTSVTNYRDFSKRKLLYKLIYKISGLIRLVCYCYEINGMDQSVCVSRWILHGFQVITLMAVFATFCIMGPPVFAMLCNWGETVGFTSSKWYHKTIQGSHFISIYELIGKKTRIVPVQAHTYYISEIEFRNLHSCRLRSIDRSHESRNQRMG